MGDGNTINPLKEFRPLWPLGKMGKVGQRKAFEYQIITCEILLEWQAYYKNNGA